MASSNLTPFAHHEGMLEIPDFLSTVSSTKLEMVENNKEILYYNTPAAFDLEASSFYDHEEKRACMYIWQFGLHGYVTYGRTWQDFTIFFKILTDILHLDDSRRLVIYVHNLKYDWQWFRKRFEWDKVFIVDERQPIVARCGGLEFRDSLILAGGVSLATVGKNLVKYPVQKAVGDLDYELVRTPITPLSPVELHYCEYDCRVLMSYIQEKIETDGDICNIPLTNTGYVRRACRKACFPEVQDVQEYDGRIDSDC